MPTCRQPSMIRLSPASKAWSSRARTPTTHSGRVKRVWHKLKVRASLEVVVTGVVGDPGDPAALVLSGATSGGELAYLGTSTRLSRSAAAELAGLLEPTGVVAHRWLTFPGGASEPTAVTLVRAFVVEVRANVAVDGGVLRHPARYLRARLGLQPADLPPLLHE